MRHPALAASIVLLALLSLVACTSASPTQAPGATSGSNPTEAVPTQPGATEPTGSTGKVPDASVLVTAEMAAAVIGGSPTKFDLPGIPGGSGVSIASYLTTSGDNLTVYIQAIPGAVTAAELQAAMALEGTNGDMTPVSGVGDAAGKVVKDHDATLAFVKGNVIVVIGASASAQSGADLESKLENLAKQIAASF